MNQVIEPIRYDLTTDIIAKKREMIDLGMKYGLADKRTIQCSQQLDDLLNKHAGVNKLRYAN